MILVAFLLNLNATSICKTAQKVIKNKEKPQKFITSGAFYLVTRTGFEPALVLITMKNVLKITLFIGKK